MKRNKTALLLVVVTIAALLAQLPAAALEESDYSEFFSQFLTRVVAEKPVLPTLVNASNALDKDYVPELVPIGSTGYKATAQTAEAYLAMREAAKKDGVYLYICSAYRSYSTQQYLYNRKVGQLKPNYGDAAYNVAATIVARPGTSEHQLGEALDFGDTLTSAFSRTKMGKWLAQNAHKFGFILRYPQNRTDITGIIFEPWHFRYVGIEHSERIYNEGWVLEEYIEYMENLG